MEFKKRSSQSGYDGPSLFLKIEDGQSVDLVLRGEIHEFQKTWPSGKTSTRFKVNAIEIVEGRPLVKIWEFGPTVYDQLTEINEVYPVDKNLTRVKRSGVEMDTTYNLMPLQGDKFKMNAQDLARLEELDLHVLDREQPKKLSSPEQKWNGL